MSNGKELLGRARGLFTGFIARCVGRSSALKPPNNGWCSQFRPGLCQESNDYEQCLLRSAQKQKIACPMQLKRVDFFVGCPEGESRRYRVDNVLDALAMRGVAGRAFEESEIPDFSQHKCPDVLVIFRARYNKNIQSLISQAKARSIPIVFDVDDLVFEPESLNYIGAVRQLEEHQKEFHLREVEAFRKTLERCDMATATTDYLAGRLDRLGLSAKVVRNTISRSQLRAALDINIMRKQASDFIDIGYFSGSPTHNVDFLEAADPLYELLLNNKNVRLNIVGELALPEVFVNVSEQVIRRPFMHHLHMLNVLAMMDFVVAPLEANNPFTAGKSELKIFEAALVKVPCVASAVDSYSRIIDSGNNGFLASTPDDWSAAFRELLRDDTKRREMGEKAYKDFVDYFYFSSIVDESVTLYTEIMRAGKLGNGDHHGYNGGCLV